MDGFANYDALADSVKAEDVASDEINAGILRRIMSNDPELKTLYFSGEEHRDEYDYCPVDAREMGWLGYFVGRNTCIKTLFVTRVDDPSVMEPFCRGIGQNRSIQDLEIYDIEGGDLIKMLGPFFRDNQHLTSFSAEECNFGAEGCRQLSLTLGGCTRSSLKTVYLYGCGINGEQLADIAVALSMHPKLENLTLYESNIGRNGCKALATLLQFSATNLRGLDLDNSGINDDGMAVLMLALAQCRQLETLDLARNASMTDKGWRGLSGLLGSPNCALQELVLRQNDIGDETMIALASGLAMNQSLKKLYLDDDTAVAPTTNSITGKGWAAISKVLCNASSVNKTYLSNHTLREILHPSIAPDDVRSLLAITRRNDCVKTIATVKILTHHQDLSMQPFFEWDFKVLPHAVDWFARAQSAMKLLGGAAALSPHSIRPKKLSAIYQFVRGMPLVYVESRLRSQLDEAKTVEAAIEQEQLKLAKSG